MNFREHGLSCRIPGPDVASRCGWLLGSLLKYLLQTLLEQSQIGQHLLSRICCSGT